MSGKIYKIDDLSFIAIVNNGQSFSGIYKKCVELLGCSVCYKSMKKRIIKMKLDVSRFTKSKLELINDIQFKQFAEESNSYAELMSKCGYVSSNASGNKNFKEIINKRLRELEIDKELSRVNYSLDETSFDKLNRNNAWILGLIFADGSIHGRRVTITSTDLVMLEQVEKILKGKNLIKERKKYKDSWKESWVLGFTSEKIHKILTERYGLHPNKDFTIEFPNIPKDLYWDFIRGIFDGDGCVIKKGLFFICSASEKFIKKLYEVMKKLGCDKLRINNYHIHKVETGRYDQIDFIYNNMYKNAVYYLPRKKHIFEYYLMSSRRRHYSKELLIPSWFFDEN